jgi:uncharacterized RDD family membrane protein YckC
MLKFPATAGLVGLVALAAAEICLAQQSAKKEPERLQLNAAGSDEILWLLVGEKEPKGKTVLNRLAYADRDSSTLHASSALPQIGEVAQAAVVGNVLHVFFTDGIHQHYSTTRAATRGVRLPGNVVPEAVAGGNTNGMPVLWAVVGADTADTVAKNWAETQRRAATQPFGGLGPESRPETQPAERPSIKGDYALVMYDGDDWRPGMPAPEGADRAERLWLCTSANRFHLFWEKSKASANIQYAWYENGQWTPGPELELPQPPVEATVQVANTELTFASLTPETRDQLHCSCWRRPAAGDAATKWTASAELRTSDGKPLLLPSGTAVAIFGSSLAVLEQTAGQAELGLWSVARGGAPESAFRAVPLRRHTSEPSSQPGVREFTTTIIVAFILLLVFWRRQSSFAVPLELPPGLAIARPAKRALGALIDIAPALLLVFWWWHGPITAFAAELRAASDEAKNVGSMPPVGFPEAVIWAGVTFRLIYAAYCMVFELWLSTTPGKRLMGCYVLSETLTRPNWLQIVIRNVSRIVELEPYLVIWPFLLVIFFTRNRQRVGDLLARTIVVDRVPRYAAPPDSPEE